MSSNRASHSCYCSSRHHRKRRNYVRSSNRSSHRSQSLICVWYSSREYRVYSRRHRDSLILYIALELAHSYKKKIRKTHDARFLLLRRMYLTSRDSQRDFRSVNSWVFIWSKDQQVFSNSIFIRCSWSCSLDFILISRDLKFYYLHCRV